MSYRKECAKERRDLRQAPAVSEVPRPKPSKNRKQWCRGKVGVEHKPVCRTYAEAKPTALLAKDGGDEFKTSDWRVLVCSTCGKELSHYYPMSFFSSSRWPTKPPPAWVDR